MAIVKNGAMNMVIQISVSLLSVILGIHSEEKFLAMVLIILFLILLVFLELVIIFFKVLHHCILFQRMEDLVSVHLILSSQGISHLN